jgi:DinB superfamily
MSLYPEQQRALTYAQKRGTDAPLVDIRGRVAGTFEAFEALVEAIPPDVARERREASGWSVQEVVDHLVESDGRALDQLAHLLAGQDDDEPIPASLQSEKPLDLDWPALLGELRRVHADILALLAGATDEHPLTARAAVQMVVKHAGPDGTLTPVSWVERFDWKAFAILLHAHNREHIAQVQRILSAPPVIENQLPG